MADKRTISVSAAELSVDIGFPCGPTVPFQTAMSLAKTAKACAERHIELGMACISGSSVVTMARNKVLDTFLRGTADHLFWIDSDIVWEPADFIRLLVLATKYDVVCAAYAQKKEGSPIVLWHDLETFELNEHGLVKFHGCGLGFTAMTRDAAQKLANSRPRIYDPASEQELADVFRIDSTPRADGAPAYRGEDCAFFADLEELGYTPWLDPKVQLGHVGQKEYLSDPMKALQLDKALEGLML